MIGSAGMISTLHYPNPAQVSGLYDSGTRSGSAFYNHRISHTQYIGANYEYSLMQAYLTHATSETQTHTISAFYTIYLRQKLSVSVSSGPQYFEVTETPVRTSRAWQPFLMASMGWQARRASFATSYTRQVTGGGGLLGAFYTNRAIGTLQWQFTRAWTAAANATYSINQSVSPLFVSANEGGHSIGGTARAEHLIGRDLRISFEYSYVHQTYNNIAAIANNPDSSRGRVTLSWQFTRPLER